MDLRHFSSLPEDEPEDEPILLQERVLEAEAEVAPLEEVARAEKKASARRHHSEIEASICSLYDSPDGDKADGGKAAGLKDIPWCRHAGKTFPHLSYSFHEEEFIARSHYNAPAVDYEMLWYGERRRKVPPEYVAESTAVAEAAADTRPEMLTAPEAEEVFMRIQYSAIVGNGSVYQVNGEERKRFDLWIKFNPALFKLLETLQGLTSNVNYSAV